MISRSFVGTSAFCLILIPAIFTAHWSQLFAGQAFPSEEAWTRYQLTAELDPVHQYYLPLKSEESKNLLLLDFEINSDGLSARNFHFKIVGRSFVKENPVSESQALQSFVDTVYFQPKERNGKTRNLAVSYGRSGDEVHFEFESFTNSEDYKNAILDSLPRNDSERMCSDQAVIFHIDLFCTGTKSCSIGAFSTGLYEIPFGPLIPNFRLHFANRRDLKLERVATP